MVLVDGQNGSYTQEGNYVSLGNPNSPLTCQGSALLCANQLGVCAGLTQQCVSGSFVVCTSANYLAYNSSYQVSETSCDSLDNDCDGTVDEGCSSNTTTTNPPASPGGTTSGGGGGGGSSTPARITRVPNSTSASPVQGGESSQQEPNQNVNEQEEQGSELQEDRRRVTGFSIFDESGKLQVLPFLAVLIFVGLVITGYFIVKRWLLIRRVRKIKQASLFSAS